MGASSWAVQVLKEGYPLEFKTKPKLSTQPFLNLNSKHPQVSIEIQSMIDKGALEKVHNPNTPGFYSRIFVVEKKTGGFRPIIDLKNLNRFLIYKPFKMESSHTIRRALNTGMWVYSVDLKDAYFHIPIHPSSRKYLRISYKNEVYQFKALPFGVSSAPWVFTKVFHQLIKILRVKGIHIHMYLDDWLGKNWEKDLCQIDRDKVIQIALNLGCVINWEKSELEVTQDFIFVGVHYNLKEGKVAPSQEKRDRILKVAQPFFKRKEVPAVCYQRIIGLLNILESVVPWGKIHFRVLQWNQISMWSPQAQSQDFPIRVWEGTKKDIFWWLDKGNLFRGAPLHPIPPQFFLNTDASLEGWGAHSEENKVYGQWDPQERKLHINVLELRAVRYSLIHLNPPPKITILVKTDNSTVVAYINRQGGTRSSEMMEETFKLFQVLQNKSWYLKARYFPGSKNVVADSLSRQNQVIPSEWSLHPAVTQAIFKVWGTPHIDLFATQDNTKLPLYVSPVPDKNAWSEDSLSISWEGLWAYAYPPTSILNRVLEKIIESNCEIILIAPCWATQPWFNFLLDLSVENPLRLPLIPHLLKQTNKNMFHRNPQHLKLHAWKLQNKTSENRDLRRTFLKELWVPREIPQEECTLSDGQSFVIGTSQQKVEVLSVPLYLK